jgi:hypothetical protein
MVGDKPKFRMVKAKKRRGIKALGRRRAIGGMERQILNPATGKYVTYLGPKQEMRLYSPDALAKIEKKEGARKLKKAAARKKAADESGLTATREKGEEILRQKKAGTFKATPLPAPPKPKAKKAEPKLDVGRPKVEDKPKAKKPPPKVRVTEAKPKVKDKPKAPAKAKVAARPRSREDIKIDIPEVINIPGVGEIKLPSKPPAAPKAEVKAKPKKEVKTPKKEAKAKSRPTPKPRPVKIPDILQEDIRITPGMLEDLIAKPVVKAKEKPKPKKEVKTPKKGKVREREDIRVPTREEIDKVIKDLNIKIPEVINIPGVGQVTIPAAPKSPVDTPKEKPIVAPPMTGGPVRTPGDTAKDTIFDPGPPRPAGNRLKSDDPFFSSPEFEAIKGKPGTRDMYTASDGTEFGSGSTGRAYERYLNRIKEEGSALPVGKGEITSMPVPSPGLPGGPIDVSRDPSPDLPPAPTAPIRVDTTPRPTPPPPPQFIDMDPLKGMRDTIIPRNILGQSFDPSVRDDYEKQMQAARTAMMQPGGNIRATEYPTYQTPTLAVPQTQFGGYGQPMPVAPLLPYAGLASATMPEQITQQRPPASGATPNPGTGQIEPIGVAPDPGLVNLPPGVTGPIR